MTTPTPEPMNLRIPYVVINDHENDHAALNLGRLQQKQHEGTITRSELVHMQTLTDAILDYQISKAAINAAR